MPSTPPHLARFVRFALSRAYSSGEHLARRDPREESRMPEDPVEVRLIIPGAPEFLRLARLAAADAGSRAGLTYDEIEDLRIGVDELCHSVMRSDGEGVVTIAFRLVDGGIVVEGEGPTLDPGQEPKPSDLSRTIVAAVVDEHDLTRDGDALRFRLIKRAHHR
jgi:anti-sigma regulatory factor (Ser/Thr protein kinase)